MSIHYYPRFKNILGLCIATLALCCTSSQKAMAQPTITSVSPGLGIGGVTAVTITGTNFNGVVANDTVFFGATRATVTSASTTSLTVTVPTGATYAPVSVLNTATRLTGYQQYQFMPRFDTSCFADNTQINFLPAVNFTAGVTSPAASPVGVTVSDVDGDGKPDVIVTYRASGTNSKIAIFRNTSATGSISLSSLAAPVTYTGPAYCVNVKAADLDGDGKPELLAVGTGVARVYVFRNQCTSGTISFAAAPTLTTLTTNVAPGEVAVGDFDADGKPDIAVVCAYGYISVIRNLITAPGTFTTSSFGTKVDFTTGLAPSSMCVTDVDGDGKPDLVCSNDFSNTISVFHNTISSAGTFSSSSFAAKVDFTTGGHPYEVQAGDIDGDGKPEIIVADSLSNTISVFQNTSTSGVINSSSFAAKVDFATGLVPEAFGMGDVNGDGKLDIVVSNIYGGSVSVFRNTSTSGSITSSSFATPVSLTVGTAPVGTFVADLDGDNKPEIITANNGSLTMSVLRNYPVPANSPIVGSDSICASGTSSYTDATSGGTWTITSHTGSVISGTGTVTAGATTGADTVSYTTTCGGDINVSTKAVTVIATPTVLPITGPGSVCVGDTIHLADLTTGGTWGNTVTAGIATVDTAGVVTGVSAGTATITYAKATVCGVISSYYNVTVNVHPGAITGTSSSICVGTTATLSCSPTGGNWNSSVSGVASITTPGGVLNAAATGVTIISYTVSTTGCRSTDTITVTALPAGITGSDTLCIGVSTILHSSGTGTWASASTGVATIDSISGLLTGVGSGTSVIRFGITGSGCYALDTVLVNTVGAPVLSISSTPATGICAGTVVTYMGNTTSGGASPTFIWTINGAAAGSGPTITYIPSNGDLIACKLFSTSACVNPDTVTSHVIVSLTPTTLPTVTIHTALGSDTVCSGNPTSLSAAVTNGGTSPQLEWYVNHVPVGFGPTLSYTPANGDIVNCYLESNIACPAIDTARDTMVLHVVPYSTPIVSMSGSSIICQGLPAIFYADATFAGAAPIYDWTVNGIITSTMNPLSYMPATGDVVQLTLTSNYPCLTYPVAVSSTATLTVVPVYLPSVSVSATNYIVLPGGIMTDTFTAVITNGGAAPIIQWYNNSTPVPGATTTRFITTAIAGRDSITCKVINTDFCNDITVYDYAIVNTGLNVGVQQVNNDHSFVTIVPNPNSGSFTLRGDLGVQTDEEIHIEITNMLGQVAYVHTTQAGNGLIDVHVLPENDLAAGTYLLTLHSEHMNRVVRFTVEK